MAEKINLGVLFVNSVPLLYDQDHVARQAKIETWLDLYQLVRDLHIEKVHTQVKYIS